MKTTLAAFSLLVSVWANAQYTFIKQWDYRYGGTFDEELTGFEKTRDGGYVLAGWSSSPVDGNKTCPNWSNNIDDFWIVKLDNNGQKEWDKCFGSFSYDYLWTVATTSDDGFILGGDPGSGSGGDITGPGKGGHDYWSIKIDKDGNKIWDKMFGGNRDEYQYGVAQARDGGYFLAGSSSSGISGDRTQANWDTVSIIEWFDYWVVKTDSLGNKQWDRRFGGVESEVLEKVRATSDGGCILGGYSHSDNSGDKSQPAWNDHHAPGISADYWIVKTDSLGNKQWDKRFGGYNVDNLYDLQQTRDGGYILGGNSISLEDGDKSTTKLGRWIIKIDAHGTKVWDKAFEGGGFFTIAQTRDEGYLIGGNASSLTVSNVDKSEPNLGEIQTWIIKTDSLGNKEWDKTIFTNASEGGYAVQSDDGCYVIANTTRGNIGGYKTQASWNNISDSSSDYWVLKFCMEPFNDINSPKSSAGDLIQVYPNPFTTDLSIALTGAPATTAEFTITNTIGHTIYHQSESNLANGYTNVLDLSYLPNGLYFVEVAVDGERIVRRVVKE